MNSYMAGAILALAEAIGVLGGAMLVMYLFA
jgi:hypothetical protein